MRKLPVLTLLLLLIVSPAAAQESADVVDSLTGEFRAAIDRAYRLDALRPQLSGEDSLVVIHEIQSSALQASGTLSRLADYLASDQLAGQVDSSITGEFRALADILWSAEVNVARRLDDTRAAAFHAEGSDARRLERELAEREKRLSLIHKVLLDQIRAMEKVGIDATADRERLIERAGVRGETLAARIRFVNSTVDELKAQMKTFPEDAGLVDELKQVGERSQIYLGSLTSNVAVLKGLDQPTAALQSVLVTYTGDITRSILDPEVATSLLQDWLAHMEDWFADNGVSVLVKVLVFLIIMAISFAGRRVVSKAVESAMANSRVKVSHLLRKMIIGFSGNLVVMAGLLVALSQIGVNLSPILAGVGVLGFIVGFALQDTLANFAAGMMILFYQPYDVGDLVEVSGVFGKVSHMSLVSTTILTIDNQTLVVPNGKIWGDVIRNVTAQRLRRVDLVFGISYTDDIPKAEKILMSILEGHDRVLDDPAPVVKLNTLNESSVDFVVRPWVKTDDYWDVHWDVTREVKMRFDAEGVSIPFPQRDVHHFVDATPAPPPALD